jgi:hypothetical protein
MSALRYKFLISLLCGLSSFILTFPAYAGEDWRPITQDELKMTGDAKAPGAPAIYLYRQVDRDDQANSEFNYTRIKILTDEGRKYGDVEIPFLKGRDNIKRLEARTIHPDGTIVNFDGKVYDKMIVKAKGVKYLAKTFTLSDVQPGSIIECRYTLWRPGYASDSSWILSDELFTRHAKFSLRPSELSGVKWSWPRGLPPGTNPPKEDNRVIRLEADNIPAFQVEDYMPPQNEMKFRVNFIYTDNVEKDYEKFWKEEDKRIYKFLEVFLDKRKAMERAVSETVSPNDPPEAKLQKIYARVQQIRNTSYEQRKTEQEEKRDRAKEINNSVEDVWKRGYGGGDEITWLFLAMARAAGFESSPILVSTRDRHLFDPHLQNPGDLNTNVVSIKVNGKDVYLDPGAQFTPYGMLPWPETGVAGLQIGKDNGTWITTPVPAPSESRVERKATLQLTDSGSLEGKATITFTGLSALWRRNDERDEDETERKKFLEDELKEYVPVHIEAELTNKPEWKSSSPTLTAEFDFKVPGWATAAGRRTLLAMGLFSGSEKHVFEHAFRVNPIYYSYPYEDTDDVTITLPPELQVSNLPELKPIDIQACTYHAEAQNKSGSLHMTRDLMVDIFMLNPKYYATIRNFYQKVRAADEQQIILSAAAANAKN